jgi:hypothetical protein
VEFEVALFFGDAFDGWGELFLVSGEGEEVGVTKREKERELDWGRMRDGERKEE